MTCLCFSLLPTAFAWLNCNDADVEDLEILLRRYKIMARGGPLFGSDLKHVRLSLLGDEETFNLFLERLSSIQDTIDNGNSNGKLLKTVVKEI